MADADGGIQIRSDHSGDLDVARPGQRKVLTHKLRYLMRRSAASDDVVEGNQVVRLAPAKGGFQPDDRILAGRIANQPAETVL